MGSGSKLWPRSPLLSLSLHFLFHVMKVLQGGRLWGPNCPAHPCLESTLVHTLVKGQTHGLFTGDNPPLSWNVSETQRATEGETYKGEDFPGNHMGSRSPEQEVQEEAPDELLTQRWSGVSVSALCSCCLKILGWETWTSKQLFEADEHCLYLCLGSIRWEIKEESRHARF